MSGPEGGSLPTARVVGLVARREIRERLRAKSFAILTALLVVIIVAFGVASRLIDTDAGAAEVGVVEPVPGGFAAAVDQVAGVFDRDVDVTVVDDASGARRSLDDGDLDAAVIGDDREVVFPGDVDDDLQSLLQQAWSSASTRQSLADAGLGADEVADALSPAPLESTTLDGDGDDTGLAVFTGTMAAILLFISLQTFGGYVLVGVVEEKSTAVVELLLARARADQLLAGKVIGIGVVALLQFVVAVAAALVSLAISGVEVPSDVWSALPLTVVWFLGGYALYSTLFALAGSLVSRQEDAQAASAPILAVLIGAYLLVFFVGYVPESTVSRVLSILPPIAPFLMPMRMAAGAASVVEVVLALVLLLLATVAAWKLAGKIYEQVLLRRGSRISWGDALGLLRRA